MNQANRRESALTFLRPDDCVARFADEQPRRIHIIGTSGGAGKTTLARRMGVSLEIPVHDLDAIAYEGASEGRPGVKRPIERSFARHLIYTSSASVDDRGLLSLVDQRATRTG